MHPPPASSPPLCSLLTPGCQWMRSCRAECASCARSPLTSAASAAAVLRCCGGCSLCYHPPLPPPSTCAPARSGSPHSAAGCHSVRPLVPQVRLVPCASATTPASPETPPHRNAAAHSLPPCRAKRRPRRLAAAAVSRQCPLPGCVLPRLWAMPVRRVVPWSVDDWQPWPGAWRHGALVERGEAREAVRPVWEEKGEEVEGRPRPPSWCPPTRPQ